MKRNSETKSRIRRFVDWYKVASKWEEVQAMNEATKKAHQPQRPNAFTEAKAKEERRARYENQD